MKGFLLIGLLCAIPVSAGWDKVAERDGLTASVGDGKITRIADSVVFWQRISKESGYSLLRIMADCDSQEYAVLNASQHNKMGKELLIDNNPSEVETANDSSLAAAGIDRACGHDKEKADNVVTVELRLTDRAVIDLLDGDINEW